LSNFISFLNEAALKSTPLLKIIQEVKNKHSHRKKNF
jgi:hypothetical protein